MWKKQEKNFSRIEDKTGAKDKLNNYRYLLKNITLDTMNYNNNNSKLDPEMRFKRVTELMQANINDESEYQISFEEFIKLDWPKLPGQEFGLPNV